MTGWMAATEGVTQPLRWTMLLAKLDHGTFGHSYVAFLRSRVFHAFTALVPVITSPLRRMGKSKILGVSDQVCSFGASLTGKKRGKGGA